MQQKGIEHDLNVGQYYKNVEDIQKLLDSYNKCKSTDFTVVTNNKRTLVVKCKHGSKHRESSISGNRSISHLGCYASITFHKSQKLGDETLKLTKANLSHNHMVRKEWENLETMNFNGKEKEMFLKLRRANTQLVQINNVLTERKKKKKITTQHSKKLLTYEVSNSGNYDKISLDALHEFLGNLMAGGDDIDARKNKNLSDKDKQKILMPVLNRIGRLITHQPTKQFLGYLEDLSKLETSIHLGYRDPKKSFAYSNISNFKDNGAKTNIQTNLKNGKSEKSAKNPNIGDKYDDPKSRSSNIHVTMKKRTDFEIQHRRDTQKNNISTIDINNFQSSDVSTIELNLRIPSFLSM